jgi:tetratricopeptide (TPR) repeat protein
VTKAIGCITALLAALGAQANNSACGPLRITGKYGPFDYRLAPPLQRDLVERAHFTEDVAELRKPMFQFFGPDLHYTLWAFPNHHRALLTLIALTEKEKTQQPKLLTYTAECYFERALRFTAEIRAEDPLVRMIYALYLKKQNRKADALTQLDFVVQQPDTPPMTNYNAAKLYFDLEEYEKSKAAMKKAVEQGVPYVDLIESLRKAGHWDN